MLVELTNFGKWIKESFEFPDSGLILISGISQAGKTTILKAISFVLYGKPKKTTWDEKKSMVRFLYKDYEIIRTSGPKRLQLIHKKQEYEDEAAQNIIYKVFGRYFLSISYISQKMTDSFLNMTPADKMKFLEELATSGDVSVSEIKELTQTRIRESKDLLNQVVAGLEIVKTEFEELKVPEIIEFPLGGKYSEVKIKNEVIYWKRTKKNLEKEITLKTSLHKQLAIKQVQEALHEKQQHIIIEIQEQLDEFNTKKEEIEYVGDEDLNILEEALIYMKNIREYNKLKIQYDEDLKNFELSEVQEIKEYTKDKESIVQNLSNIKSVTENEISLMKDVIKTLESLTKAQESLDKKREEYKKKTELYGSIELLKKTNNEKDREIKQNKKKKNELWECTKRKECPQCGASLKIVNEELIKIETNLEEFNETHIRDEINMIDVKLVELNKIIESNKRNITIIEHLTKEIEGIESTFEELSGKLENQQVDIEEMRDELTVMINNNKTHKELTEKKITIENKIKNKEYSNTLMNLQKQLKIKKTKIDKLKKDMKEEIESEYTEEELQKEITKEKLSKSQLDNCTEHINDCNSRLNKAQKVLASIVIEETDYEELITEVDQKIKELQDNEKKHKNTDEEINRYLKYKEEQEEYDKWNNKVIELQKKEELYKKELTIYEMFRKKTQEAESIVIGEAIDYINCQINIYLEQFFPKESLMLEIKPYKENKNGIKPSINIVINFNGRDIPFDDENISGGAKDRFVLAMTLTLNTIWGSDLLLLDESLASLDADILNEILEKIKENTSLSKKLIIVVQHQIEEGVFDEVIRV